MEMAWESSIGCSDVYIYYLGHGRDYRRIQRWKGWEGSGSWREVSGVNGGKWGVLDIWGVLINIRIIEFKMSLCLGDVICRLWLNVCGREDWRKFSVGFWFT